MKDRILEQKKATETLSIGKHDPSQMRMNGWIGNESSWGKNHKIF